MSQRGCLLIIVDLGSNSKFIFADQRNLQGLQKEKMRERNHVHPKVKDNDKRSNVENWRSFTHTGRFECSGR